MTNRDKMNILININTVLYFKPLYLHKIELVNFCFSLFFTIHQSILPPSPTLSQTQLTNARNNAAKQERHFTTGRHESSENRS